jgi:tRNA (Thr-GGU) A37 N-methylase
MSSRRYVTIPLMPALLQRIDSGTVYVRGLDCIDETPLLDLGA